MMELVVANWLIFVIALLVGIAIAWWVFVANRKTRVITSKPDVLEEGAQRAQRNQALIDTPPVPAAPPPAPAEPEATPAPASTLATAPAPTPTPTPTQTVAAGEDDLRRIKGLGPKLAKLLNSLGVTSFAQIAAWSDEDIDRIDAQLGTFAGRIRRDNWVEQAKFLAAGDVAGFEDKFGSL